MGSQPIQVGKHERRSQEGQIELTRLTCLTAWSYLWLNRFEEFAFSNLLSANLGRNFRKFQMAYEKPNPDSSFQIFFNPGFYRNIGFISGLCANFEMHRSGIEMYGKYPPLVIFVIGLLLALTVP